MYKEIISQEDFKNKLFEVSEENLKVNVEDKALVYIYKENCSPCMLLKQELDKITEKVEIFKVKATDFIDLLDGLGIRSLPTLMFIDGANNTVDMLDINLKSEQYLEKFNGI